jgi:hypothetical protein
LDSGCVADPDPHHFWKLDPDPHQTRKLDPDPDQSEKQDEVPYPHRSEEAETLKGHFVALEGPNLEKCEW